MKFSAVDFGFEYDDRNVQPDVSSLTTSRDAPFIQSIKEWTRHRGQRTSQVSSHFRRFEESLRLDR